MTAEILASLSARVTALETKDAVDEVHRNNIITRLASIEDTLKWLSRLIFSFLVLGVLGAVVQFSVLQ